MAIVLALISGAAHAAWNALAKVVGKEHRGSERVATLVVLTFGLLTGLLSLLAVSLPMELSGTPALRVPSSSLPFILLAGLGESAYVVSLGIAYQKGDLSITYAASRATALIVIWPVSWVLFGTAPSELASIATALVVVGIALSAPPRTGTATQAVRWSVPWTLATGLSVGLYHAGYKGAVQAGASPIPAFVLALFIAVPLLWGFFLRGPRLSPGEPNPSPRPLFLSRRLWLAGALSAASFILLIVALTTADSGRMLGVRNSSVGFAILIALALGERPSPKQWAGLGFLGAGVLLLGYEEFFRA